MDFFFLPPNTTFALQQMDQGIKKMIEAMITKSHS